MKKIAIACVALVLGACAQPRLAQHPVTAGSPAPCCQKMKECGCPCCKGGMCSKSAASTQPGGCCGGMKQPMPAMKDTPMCHEMMEKRPTQKMPLNRHQDLRR